MHRYLPLAMLLAISHLSAADFAGQWTGTIKPSGPNIVLRIYQYADEFAGTVATFGDPAIPFDKMESQGGNLLMEAVDPSGRHWLFDCAAGAELTCDVTVAGTQYKLSPLQQSPLRLELAQRPELLSKVDPEYTAEALKARLQGSVVLRADINRVGKAVNISVTHGLGRGLDEKAIAALKRWQFRPASKGNEPITFTITIEVNFRLPK